MFDMSVKWPNGARVAVMLTFDFDAETLWTSRDPENAKRPGVLSQGRYGANVGVFPRSWARSRTQACRHLLRSRMDCRESYWPR
jgi:hypothetical protein